MLTISGLIIKKWEPCYQLTLQVIVKYGILNRPIGDHFNKPGNLINNLTVSVIEKVKLSEKEYLI